MLDQATQLAIQEEVKKQLTDAQRLNAKGVLFDPNTGMATQGQNVYGSFGNKVFHNMFRLAPTDQTIASGVINASSASILVYTESSASSDNLDTINPGSLVYAGEELIMLRAGDDADTVVVKNNTGNIICSGDFYMASQYDRLFLQWDATNAKWVEVCRTNSNEWSKLDSKRIDILPFNPNATSGAYTIVNTGGAFESLFNAEFTSAGAQNNYADYIVYLQAGTYDFKLIHNKDSNRGIYTIYVDDVTATAGTTSIGTIDGYNAGLSANAIGTITGFVIATGGNKTVRIQMATKNAASSAYYATISLITILRTSTP